MEAHNCPTLSAKRAATYLQAPVSHAMVTAWRRNHGQQQLSLEGIYHHTLDAGTKPPWLLLLPDDVSIDINLNMVLYNILETVSKGKLCSPHHLAAFTKLLSAMHVTKKKNEQAGTQLSPISDEQQ